MISEFWAWTTRWMNGGGHIKTENTGRGEERYYEMRYLGTIRAVASLQVAVLGNSQGWNNFCVQIVIWEEIYKKNIE